jgi:hypothetical protein
VFPLIGLYPVFTGETYCFLSLVIKFFSSSKKKKKFLSSFLSIAKQTNYEY